MENRLDMVIGTGWVALVVTVGVLVIWRRWAVRMGWVYRPRPDRWQPKFNPHPRTIALGGGLGIATGALIALLLWGLLNGDSLWLRVLPLAGMASLLGLIDDMWDCSARLKLLVQFTIGLTTALWVVRLPAFPDSVSVPLTAFCLVALMNAVNMMDNMDGTASGLVTLSALGFVLLSVLTAHPSVMGASLILAGSSCGFWLFNKPPASIFMGDAGSLLLGYLLGVIAIASSHGHFAHEGMALLAPILMVGTFVADMTFVVLWRLTHGLPIMKGDRNHLSHRLAMRFGRSEWHANFVLYGMQALLCGGGLLAAVASPFVGLSLILATLLLLSLLFLWLWQVIP